MSGNPLSATGGAGQQVRRLNVHEYVAMKLMADHNIDIPVSIMADTPEDAEKACAEIMGDGGEEARGDSTQAGAW